MTTQKDAFFSGEADSWFQRNRSALKLQAAGNGKTYPEVQWICEQLLPMKEGVNRVLEVGCSNGAKLRQICRGLSAKGVGIDPSQLAVCEGNAFGEVELHLGTASDLPFDDESFDLVYFGFCLYLFDRKDLLAAVAEADRVLKTGGFLAITDFDPIQRHKRPYHHQDGVFSYKQDYSKCFTESGLYFLVSKHSFSHRQFYFDSHGDERVSTTILFKEVDAYRD